MREAKYIVVDNMKGCEGIVVFPNFEDHFKIASLYGGKDHVVSAGTCNIYFNIIDEELVFECHGKSTTLEINARKDEDSKLLKRMFSD